MTKNIARMNFCDVYTKYMKRPADSILNYNGKFRNSKIAYKQVSTTEYVTCVKNSKHLIGKKCALYPLTIELNFSNDSCNTQKNFTAVRAETKVRKYSTFNCTHVDFYWRFNRYWRKWFHNVRVLCEARLLSFFATSRKRTRIHTRRFLSSQTILIMAQLSSHTSRFQASQNKISRFRTCLSERCFEETRVKVWQRVTLVWSARACTHTHTKINEKLAFARCRGTRTRTDDSRVCAMWLLVAESITS